MKLGEKEHRALRPDAQAFDEVRIVTVPRYKSSGLSGDEWRISAKTQLIRKGRIIAEFHNSKVETAVMSLGFRWLEAIDDGKAYFAGEGDTCDQEGCSEVATVTYRLKKNYCREGHATDPHWIEIRKFCQRHSKRGDCGLEDADENYVLVGGTVSDPSPSDVKESSFGGVVVIPEEQRPINEN